MGHGICRNQSSCIFMGEASMSINVKLISLTWILITVELQPQTWIWVSSFVNEIAKSTYKLQSTFNKRKVRGHDHMKLNYVWYPTLVESNDSSHFHQAHKQSGQQCLAKLALWVFILLSAPILHKKMPDW